MCAAYTGVVACRRDSSVCSTSRAGTNAAATLLNSSTTFRKDIMGSDEDLGRYAQQHAYSSHQTCTMTATAFPSHDDQASLARSEDNGSLGDATKMGRCRSSLPASPWPGSLTKDGRRAVLSPFEVGLSSGTVAKSGSWESSSGDRLPRFADSDPSLRNAAA